MANVLLISVAPCDTRLALVEDGRLAEFYLEGRNQLGPTGNIYKGRVIKLLPGMAAAFVEVGLERPAYLFGEEVQAEEDEFFSLWLKDELKEAPELKRSSPLPISDILHEGQEVLVQVQRGPTATKGARLTTHISLAGHYLVYLPTLPHLGISRRISEAPERQRLKALLDELKPREGGLIARTASRGQEREQLARERDGLAALWEKIRRRKETVAAPALIHQELQTSQRALREWLSPEIDRVVVDDPATYEQLRDYLGSLGSGDQYRLELYSGTEPLFSHFGVEIDWKRLLSSRVWLKSGGYLLFDTTEALTAVDVNTGRFLGKNHLEETLLKTNLEAAKEVARQLRLRNIGGLIVIDFIDLAQAEHRDQVYQALLQELSRDRAKTTALPISSLGLVEMTRQRLRDSLARTISEPCSCCGGQGEVLAPATLTCDILRQLDAEAREFPGCRLTLVAHPEITATLKQEGEELLTSFSAAHKVRVTLTDQPRFPRDYFEITHEWPE
jgi:ribonuclease G